MKITKEAFSLVTIVLGYVLIATYHIEEIPGEWYGDISIFHEYVQEILSGQWPFYFSLAAGPFHNYLIAPIIAILGVNYISYKLASIVLGAIGIIFIYLLSKSLFSPAIGALTSLITAISFWYLAWSRLGNPEIITVPILTSSMTYFLIRFIREKRWQYMLLGISVASLGLFTYVATFILPLVYLLMLAAGFSTQTLRNKIKILLVTLFSFIPPIIILTWIIIHQPENFTTGYVGIKFFSMFQENIQHVATQFIKNVIRTVLMLHVEGDIVFRWNVPKSPHLDMMSGIFFFLGLLYWYKWRRGTLLFLLIPLLLLPLPSVSPALPPVEIPSSARTIGIIPFVYLLVASGLWGFFTFISRWVNVKVGYIVLIGSLAIILYLNLHKYFVLYPQTLPNQNTPYGKIIASYIDTLPPNTKVYLTSCCWGDWGQPEPKGIYYVLKQKKGRENMIREPFLVSCSQVTKRKQTVLIFNPNDFITMQRFRSCFPHEEFKNHIHNNQQVFISLYFADL